jgi:ketosteroid isomerase-like protein
MSQENVELIRRSFAAYDAGDLAGMIALMDEKMVTRRLAPGPDPGTWHGIEGALQVTAEWMETFDDFAMTAEEYIDAGDHVVVRVREEGRGSASRAPVTAIFWFVFGVRDGKIATWDMYFAREQALEAVGLPA